MATNSTPLSLGGHVFTDITTPQELSFLPEQSQAIHNLIGGRRIVQNLGVVWGPLSWEGTLWGTTALVDDTSLMQMMNSGATQKFKYINYLFDVVVKSYNPTYRHRNKIEYKIVCTILRDRSGKTTKATPTSVDTQASSALVNANGSYKKLSGVNTNVTA